MNSINIFYSERDHYKWGKQKEHMMLIEDIDEVTRSKAIATLNFMEQEFGAHF